MIEFIAVVVLVASIWFFLKLRKKQAGSTPLKNTPESVKPTKSADTVAANEKITPTPTVSKSAQPISQAENKPSVEQASNKTVSASENCNLPQDSMLRRHYLTNLRAILTEQSPRPTDSALSRHYDALIASKIEQCLNAETAMAQLTVEKTTTATKSHSVSESATTSKTTSDNVVIATPKVTTTHTTSTKTPEDSALRRHYITHLYAQVAASLPPCPTDATLRRHYEAMLENEVKNQLAN